MSARAPSVARWPCSRRSTASPRSIRSPRRTFPSIGSRSTVVSNPTARLRERGEAQLVPASDDAERFRLRQEALEPADLLGAQPVAHRVAQVGEGDAGVPRAVPRVVLRDLLEPRRAG